MWRICGRLCGSTGDSRDSFGPNKLAGVYFSVLAFVDDAKDRNPQWMRIARKWRAPSYDLLSTMNAGARLARGLATGAWNPHGSSQASSNARSRGVSLRAVCGLTFGAVRGTTIRRTFGPRPATGTRLATGTITSGFVVLGMWSGRRKSSAAGAGAVTAASGVRSSLPDRAPDVAARAAASNIKSAPRPCGSESEARPGLWKHGRPKKHFSRLRR